LFEDDIKLHRVANSDMDSANLQGVLDAVIDWCQKLQLNVNILKYSVLHLGKENINSNLIESVYILMKVFNGISLKE